MKLSSWVANKPQRGKLGVNVIKGKRGAHKIMFLFKQEKSHTSEGFCKDYRGYSGRTKNKKCYFYSGF